MAAPLFHQFEVTRPLRGSGEILTRTVILPADTDLHRLYRDATEIRALGATTRQIWEVVAS